MRDQSLHYIVAGINPYPQPVLKPHLLDREIEPQKIQFIPERDLLRLCLVQRMPKQIAQPAEHRFRLSPLLLAHQNHDRPERIEEKMRLQLHLQGAQLRRGQLLSELRRVDLQLQSFPLPPPRLPVRPEERLQAHYSPISDDRSLQVDG